MEITDPLHEEPWYSLNAIHDSDLYNRVAPPPAERDGSRGARPEPRVVHNRKERAPHDAGEGGVDQGGRHGGGRPAPWREVQRQAREELPLIGPDSGNIWQFVDICRQL